MLSIQNENFYQARFLFKNQKKNNNIAPVSNNMQTVSYSIYDIPFKGFYRHSYENSSTLSDDTSVTNDDCQKADKWTEDILKLTNKTSKDIRNNMGFNLVTKKLRFNLLGIKKKYNLVSYGEISGLLEINQFARGKEYFQKYIDRYNERKDRNGFYRPKSNINYYNANVCKIKSYSPYAIIIVNGTLFDNGVSNLKYAKKEYEKLKSNKNLSLKDINRSVATIHWLMLQESPYKNLNPLTADILTRAIYSAYGVTTYELKKDVSLEYEAYYNNLDDYIKNYPNYFEQPPEMV